VEIVRVPDVVAALEQDPPLVVVDLDAPCTVEELENATRAVATSQVPVVGRLNGNVPERIGDLLNVLTTTLGTSPQDNVLLRSATSTVPSPASTSGSGHARLRPPRSLACCA
jgi:hypothetical protein